MKVEDLGEAHWGRGGGNGCASEGNCVIFKDAVTLGLIGGWVFDE